MYVRVRNVRHYYPKESPTADGALLHCPVSVLVCLERRRTAGRLGKNTGGLEPGERASERALRQLSLAYTRARSLAPLIDKSQALPSFPEILRGGGEGSRGSA